MKRIPIKLGVGGPVIGIAKISEEDERRVLPLTIDEMMTGQRVVAIGDLRNGIFRQFRLILEASIEGRSNA